MVWVRFALVSVGGLEGSGDANCFADAPICRPFCELRSSFSSLGYRERSKQANVTWGEFLAAII